MPEFAPGYIPPDTPGVPPGPPRRPFNPEQGGLFSQPITQPIPASLAGDAALPLRPPSSIFSYAPLVSPIPPHPATDSPASSDLISPHIAPAPYLVPNPHSGMDSGYAPVSPASSRLISPHITPAPYPPPNPRSGMDSGYAAYYPWHDPNGDLASSHSSVTPYAPSLAPPLGLGLSPTVPLIPTAPRVSVPTLPVLVTAPYEPIFAPPVIVTAPYEPVSTTHSTPVHMQRVMLRIELTRAFMLANRHCTIRNVNWNWKPRGTKC